MGEKKTSKNATLFSKQAQIQHAAAVMHRHPLWHSSASGLFTMHEYGAAQEYPGANMTSLLASNGS